MGEEFVSFTIQKSQRSVFLNDFRTQWTCSWPPETIIPDSGLYQIISEECKKKYQIRFGTYYVVEISESQNSNMSEKMRAEASWRSASLLLRFLNTASISFKKHEMETLEILIQVTELTVPALGKDEWEVFWGGAGTWGGCRPPTHPLNVGRWPPHLLAF